MRIHKKFVKHHDIAFNGNRVYDRCIDEEKAHESILASIDWNFSDAVTDGYTHSFHAYPARFIPQIPRELLCVFTPLGGTVMDPFVGGGTTCVEANCEGRNAIASDLSSLATLITKVKTTPLSDKELELALQTCEISHVKVGTKKNMTNLALSKDWFDDEILERITLIKC